MLRALFIIISLTALMCIACKSKITAPTVSEDNTQYVGALFEKDSPLSFNDLMTQLKKEDAVEDVAVKGKVISVCQAKGCWMNLTSETHEDDEPIFVKFKDYGFFVPKDLSGESVIMHGRAYKEVTSVDELRHYAEDEGKSDEFIASITEPKEEYKFMADGVILSDR